jgi:hypothetical protein
VVVVVVVVLVVVVVVVAAVVVVVSGLICRGAPRRHSGARNAGKPVHLYIYSSYTK